MAEKITVKAIRREKLGKQANKSLRRKGMVPLVVYGGGGESIPVAAKLTEIAAILRSETGYHTVFTLDVENIGLTDVIFQDRQIHPVTGRLLHADLRRVAKGQKIEVEIPIHLVGEPEGVKTQGGILEQILREVKVLCDPLEMPEYIELDVSHLKVGQSLHVSDAKFPEGIEVHEEPEAVIATVVYVKEEDLEPQLETGAEPEVIKKEKPEKEE
ncbi:MAG: 50S ribosomal protein L25 [Pyrinomonadaceae bacterium]|nr:50S ribosomal protein L25 [Pyrinomonadaceae bacterium]MCX7640938.1 50S ribosomal protein L25 [Pyrinomonadaceae bacterium]MDW8304720.1 50S ribosomal protein L25 [Acidobacteriota bacterium]